MNNDFDSVDRALAITITFIAMGIMGFLLIAYISIFLTYPVITTLITGVALLIGRKIYPKILESL